MRLITPKRLRENEEFMWRLAEQQLDEFVANGRCEFISEFSQPFAMLVVADLLGVPESDHARFREGFGLSGNPGEIGSGAEGQQAGNSLGWLDQAFVEYVEDRRRAPRQDVLTDLALATYPDGSTPEAIAVVRTATFLFAAGQETTARLLASALKQLALNPELQDELREHHDRIPNFIEETLRVESPVKADFRLARTNTTIGDVDVPAGTPVMLLNGAANRDPRASSVRPSSVPTGPTRWTTWPSVAGTTRVPGHRSRGRRAHQHRAHPRPHARHPVCRRSTTGP